MLWFLNNVYPRICSESPYASLIIVGKSPSDRLRGLVSRKDSIFVTGWVDDTGPHQAEAEVVVVPLPIDGGARIKIPKAMAMEKPIVSTTLEAEGLSLVPDHDILLAGGPQDFARSVSNLLHNAERNQLIGGAARRKVLEDFTWEAVAEKTEELIEHVARPAGTPKCKTNLESSA